MKTYSAKPSDIEKKWILIDAENLVVGRLAAVIATRLRGKHLPTFTPHMDTGDHVIVINADKVKFTGKETTPEKVLEGKFPERLVEMAVKRMLPRGPMARKQFSNLKVYAGSEHPHVAQSPEVLDVASMNTKNVRA
jgi:large subunit ribosomal protein L13